MNIISKVVEVITENSIRFIKILRFGKYDVVNTKMVSSFGNDFNVPKDYKVLYTKTSNSNEPICIGFINKVILDDLNAGENQYFSTNEAGDTIAAFVKLLNTGVIELNGNTDNLIGYAKSKIGFDTAIEDLNKTNAELNKLITALNSWVTVPQDGGAALKLLISANPPTNITDSTANIDESKKNNLKTE